MGKRGPKPKPSVLKRLSGTWRPGLNPNEPDVPRGFPTVPSHLTEPQRIIWEEVAVMLYETGLLTRVDGMALEGLVKARVEEIEADDMIRRTGMLIRINQKTNAAGVLIPNTGRAAVNPAYHVRNAAADRVKGYLDRFGMSPSQRVNIVAAPMPLVPLKKYQRKPLQILDV